MSAVAPVQPRDGYALRVHHLLTELAHAWSIALVAPPGAGEIAGLAHWWPVPARPGSLRGIPAYDEHDARMRAEVQRAVAEWKPAALLVWPGTEHTVLGIPGLPPILSDRIDCSTLTVCRALRQARRPRDVARGLQDLLENTRYERRLVRGSAATVVVGNDDARWLRRIGGRDVQVVPNGVRLPEAALPENEAREPTAAFTGVLNYDPNVTAALFLAREIWPRVRAAVPEAELVIAGRNPTAAVEALAAQPGVRVRGNVPDMADVLRRAWLAVAPLQSGAGIKNKVLEAWAVGRPVVLSPLAANGLWLDAEASRWIAAGAAETAARIVELLSSSRERRRAGAHARALATAHHSWREAAHGVSEQLQLASRARSGSRAR